MSRIAPQITRWFNWKCSLTAGRIVFRNTRPQVLRGGGHTVKTILAAQTFQRKQCKANPAKLPKLVSKKQK
jgi:hypothetical protein